ncbi:hypothetical protein EII34_06825 [Arachnia propionica]|uniref:DUF559 domain-containing protein n=1 Tax=Arachnia propionica TaxID=1750 RepID=A0A3P1T7R0_9ACTN|nr:hypothetical protein [Arachnia propionica]RRD05439.1 hypothetical protein EII34_06825 [Arachnia propionica]
MSIYQSTSSFGIITRQDALRSGMSRREFDDAVAVGNLKRLDRCHYALPEAEADVVSAVTAGAALACASVLRLHGLDTWNDTDLHLQLPRYGRRTRPIPEGALICERGEATSRHLAQSLDQALVSMARHHTTEQLVVALDSALQCRLRTRAELHSLLQGAGRRVNQALQLATGTAESPLESVLRFRLARSRIRSAPQVVIPGVGRVDLLVEGRMILEADGRQWHQDPNSFDNDRRRDREALLRGYVTLRVTHRQLMEEWPSTLHTIRAVLRRTPAQAAHPPSP